MDKNLTGRWQARCAASLSRRAFGIGAAAALAAVTAARDADAKKKKKKKKKPGSATNCAGRACGGACGSCGAGTVCTGGQCSTYRFVTKWGGNGAGDGQFDIPRHIAVAPGTGIVYVSDPFNDRIQTFDANGTFLGSLNFPSASPEGVAIDGDGNAYVATSVSGSDVITKLDSAGAVLDSWGTGVGTPGSFTPWAVATRTVGDGAEVFVAENFVERIQRFDGDGVFVTHWGSDGTGDGQFTTPSGIAVDPDGNVFTVDSNGHRVQKFTSDGGFVTKWGSRGEGNQQFQFPSAIAVDSDGSVFVADSFNRRILKFDGDGNFITKWGSNGSEDGQFLDPVGVAVDDDGNVYVLDGSSFNARVQKFAAV